MASPFKTTRRVEFRDTDAAGIAHFSTFFTFMESAEHEFLRHLGLSVKLADADGTITWPRVAARCEYTSSAAFEDVLDIEVRLARLGSKSATYEFAFSLAGRAVAAGEMTSVCCRQTSDGRLTSIPIPDWIAEKLRARMAE